MTSEQQLARNAGTLAAGQVLAAIADSLLPIVLVRLIGKPEVGALTGVLLVYQTIAAILVTGFPATLTYHLAGRAPAERAAITRRIARLLAGVGAVAGVVMLAGGLLAVAAGPSEWALLAWLAPLPIVDLPSRLLPNLLVAEGRAPFAAGLGIGKALGTAVAVVIPLSLGASLEVVVLTLVGIGLAYGAILPAAIAVIHRGVPRVGSPVGLRELLRFALPLGVTDVVTQLNARIDRWMVLLVFPAAVYAEYQAGAWQVPFVTIVPFAVASAYAPHYATLYKSGQAREAIALWRRTIVKVALIVVPCTAVFVVAAEDAAAVLFTDRYAGAAPVLRAYAVLTLGRVAAFGPMMVAAGRPGLLLRCALVALVSNTVLGAAMLALFGSVGPALGAALAFVPTAVAYCLGIARASRIPLREVFPLGDWLRIVGLAGLAGAIAYLARPLFPAGAAGGLVAQAAITIGGFWLLAALTGDITRREWRYFRSFLAPR